MTDTGKRVADQRGEIVLDQPHEVEYWTHHLGVSEQELRAAVQAVSTVAPMVRLYLFQHARKDGP